MITKLKLLIFAMQFLRWLSGQITLAQIAAAEAKGEAMGEVRAWFAYQEWIDGKVSVVELDRINRVRVDPSKDPHNRANRPSP